MLSRNRFMVRERVRLLRLTDKFDIYDPETGSQIGYAKEEPAGFLKAFRLLVNKKLLPNVINFYQCDTPGDEDNVTLAWTMRKSFSLFRKRFFITTPDGKDLGSVRSKILTIGGGLKVFSPDGREIADLKGNLIGWDFKLVTSGGDEIGEVTKKWAGGLKEFLTSADNYFVAVKEGAPKGVNVLLLSCAIAIDAVFKEKS